MANSKNSPQRKRTNAARAGNRAARPAAKGYAEWAAGLATQGVRLLSDIVVGIFNDPRVRQAASGLMSHVFAGMQQAPAKAAAQAKRTPPRKSAAPKKAAAKAPTAAKAKRARPRSKAA